MKMRILFMGFVTCLLCSCGTSVDDLAKDGDNIFVKRTALAISFSGSDTSDDDDEDDDADAFKEMRKEFEESGLELENIYINNGSYPSIDVSCSDKFGPMKVRMFADQQGTMFNFYSALKFKVNASFEDVTSQIENTDFSALHNALLNSKEDIKDDYVLFNAIDPESNNRLKNMGHAVYDDEPKLYYEKDGEKELYVVRYYAITGSTIKIKVEEDGCKWDGLRQEDKVGRQCTVTIGICKDVVENM